MHARDAAFKNPATLPWLPMGASMQTGGLEWKLLEAHPQDSRWTVMYRGPAGSNISAHIHDGEAEGYLFYGSLTTGEGGSSAAGEGFIREPARAHHPRTTLLADTCFYLTMEGPIRWQLPDGGERLQTPADALEEWTRQLAAFNAGQGA